MASRDEAFGTRDARGHWTPNRPVSYPKVFVWPLQLAAIFRWFVFDYVLSFNLLYAVVAVAVWVWAIPSIEVMQTLSVDWIGFLFLRNAALVIIWFGAWHIWLYVKKAQGTEFKYNPDFPAKNPRFIGGSQLAENLIFTFASGVTIWTAVEALMMWAYANSFLVTIRWSDRPIYLFLLFLAIPFWRELHFYTVHRIIHWRPLYMRIHRLHHKNTNPTPWSGLSMHPAEHLPYFTGVLIHLIIPAHPVIVLYQLIHAGLSPAPPHAGFEKLTTGAEAGIETHGYAHYLHHKYFECNYADGVIPLDKWFGSFCDGTPEGIAEMRQKR